MWAVAIEMRMASIRSDIESVLCSHFIDIAERLRVERRWCGQHSVDEAGE